MIESSLLAGYRRLTEGCGFVRLPGRTLLELTGADRRKFLHNFCTADVNAMADNSVSEAFVLNAKGKVLGHVLLVSFTDRLLISGAGNQAGILQEHLERYIIRDDVCITDKSIENASVFVCGKDADTRIFEVSKLRLGSNLAVEFKLGDVSLIMANTDVAGQGYLLIVNENQLGQLADKLTTQGIQECSEDSLEIVRLANGTPWYGREIDESNLPQELDRDHQAISFTKGCYLGQETVARIDSLGHVNRLLRRLSINSESVPEIGAEILIGDKKVGTVLSAARAPLASGYLALALLKSFATDSGQKLTVTGNDAVVL